MVDYTNQYVYEVRLVSDDNKPTIAFYAKSWGHIWFLIANHFKWDISGLKLPKTCNKDKDFKKYMEVMGRLCYNLSYKELIVNGEFYNLK